jgi:hypothetical protein
MSDLSPNLQLPYLAAAQAQKHVTHNEALRMLDAITQIGVLDRDLAAPPASPSNGDRYIVAPSATGVWTGKSGLVAAFQDDAWIFYAPRRGWLAHVADESLLVVYNGSAWVAAAAGSGGSSTGASIWGVNATADTTNRLSVASPASLFDHEGAGHQLKINKAAAANTASLLFQDAFSGRAELGLAGDDNLHVKVSADGTTWREARVVDRSTGVVSLPLTPRREVLTAARTYYVRPDGSDANTGLADTAAGAFLTLQKAIDTVAALDIGTNAVTIRLADGTYTSGAVVTGAWSGSGTVTLLGDTSAPGNVIVSTTASNGIMVRSGARLTISGLELRTSGGGNCIYANSGSTVTVGAAVRFGACAAYHMYAEATGVIQAMSAYTIAGNAFSHVGVFTAGVVQVIGNTITISAGVTFSGQYAYTDRGGMLEHYNNTFSGTATGVRYTALRGGGMFVNGAASTYFPGSAAGAATAPGWYG